MSKLRNADRNLYKKVSSTGISVNRQTPIKMGMLLFNP